MKQLIEFENGKVKDTKLTSMRVRDIFDDCLFKEEELDITNFNVENVTNWSTMFGSVPTTIQITTNQNTANWIKENFPSYTNITVVE